MNNSLYEDYMRSVLGYNPIDYRNTYDINYDNMYSMPEFNETRNEELEEYYPDIYKLVYPMVQKICMQTRGTITRDVIDNMTNEVYFNIEDNEVVENNRNVSEKDKKLQENRGEDRQIRNNTLRDLIRILLIRELVRRPNMLGRPPMRPPFPGPGRPPFGPGPGGPRPPRPRYNAPYGMDDRYDVFEY